ncbi:MAG: DUF255 domain-containing protein, partial [Planctomycetaceae bacterium]|nr:DUF255 domain-containing protein [Planctomycetaceae bacterium]
MRRAARCQRLSALGCCVIALLIVGCIDADQGAVVVKPQKKSKSGSAASESSSTRKPTRRASGTDDPKLEQELATVDELIRQAGGSEADKLGSDLDEEIPGQSPISAAFAEEPAATKKATPKAGKSNRLAKESSPYLLLHAHNPVEWFPWGPVAVAKATKEGKRIVRSIGDTSWHWCPVM